MSGDPAVTAAGGRAPWLWPVAWLSLGRVSYTEVAAYEEPSSLCLCMNQKDRRGPFCAPAGLASPPHPVCLPD